MNPLLEPQSHDTPGTPETSSEQPRHSFSWGWLVLAMGMYALVILSPKIAQQEIMLADYHSLQRQMQADKVRLDRLHRVGQSLRTDPELAHQILNDHKLIQKGDREILLMTESASDQRPSPRSVTAETPLRQPHWYAPIVIFIGENELVRGFLLCVVIVLILMTFVSAPASAAQHREPESDPAEQESVPRPPNFLSRLKQRYGQQLELEIDDELEKRLLELASEEDEWELDALPIDDQEEEEEEETTSPHKG